MNRKEEDVGTSIMFVLRSRQSRGAGGGAAGQYQEERGGRAVLKHGQFIIRGLVFISKYI